MSNSALFSSMTHEEFQQHRFFDSLTGLRAVAAILVIVVHYGGDQNGWLCGWLGVQIFFVLSGFLITTLLLRERDKAGKISLPKFYIRRAFRIIPVYLVLLAVTTVQSYKLGADYWPQMRAALPYYLTFMNEQVGPAPWKLTWTLGIEWKFYLIWPAIAFIWPAEH